MRVHAVALRSGLDREANAAAARTAVLRAADDGAALVVLPEYAAAFDPRGVSPDQAEPLDGTFVTALAEVAERTGAVVVAGTVLPGARPERAVNAVVAVGPAGVLGTYRKVHLYDAFGHRESERLEAGDPAAPPLVVPVGDLRVGVMTCYDLRFPEAARRLVDAGATVLAVPAAWAAGEHKADHWATLLRARAIESTAYVLGATQQGRGVVGGPAVVDPQGVVLDGRPDAGADGPERAVADVDAATVEAVRERNPSLVNRRYRVLPGGPGLDMG
ncbi:hydrolase [Actinotalea ferrariae]|nr:hydrolase [Actinotalea ferrariae]